MVPSASSPLLEGAAAASPTKPPREYATFALSSSTRSASPFWFSRVVFGFASDLLALGRQRQLDLADLLELDDRARSRTAYTRFKAAYTVHRKSVMRALFAVFGWRLFLCGLGSMVMAACAVFAPAVLHHVIDAFAAPRVDMENLTLWVGGFFASRLVNALMEANVNFYLEITLLNLTVSLKSLIFEKAMRRSLQSKHDADMVDVSNLFTADVDSILWAGYSVNSVWILPIQVSVVIYMLYQVLDVAAFAGLGVIFLFMLLNYLVAKGYIKNYHQIMETKDARMKVVKEVFNAIQIVKLNAWEGKVLDRIQQLRVVETNAIARYLYMVALSIFLFWSSPLFVSSVSFATYALVLGRTLTAAKVFTAMVLFNAIREPLSSFPDALQTLLQARIALTRMAKYLDAEEVHPERVSRDAENYDKDIEISVEHASFQWPSVVAAKEDDAQPPENTKTKPLLADVHFQVRQGDLVVIHGAVGTGKSSLCAALVGELPRQTGKVFVRTPSIAYYSQQPWIQNLSIRDNIVFGSPFDARKYERVIDACGLTKDLAMFPAGDATEIGQKGVNLSGGQKARVALARACYSEADVLVLDAPLAAVDAVVQTEIFNKCLCGLLEHKTVVLVTHLHEIIESEAANVVLHLTGDGQAQVTYRKPSKPRREYARLRAASESETIDGDGEDDKTPPATTSNATLIEEEERAAGRVSPKVLKAYFEAIGGYRVVAIFLVVLALWQACQVSSDLWLSHWTGSKSADAMSPESVKFNVAVYAGLGMGAALFVLARAVLLAHIGVVAGKYLFFEMTRSLLRAPLRFFDANPIGRIVNRYSEDISTVDFRMPFAVFGLFVSVAINVFQLATAVYVIRYAGVLVVPLAYAYVHLSSYYLSTSREIARLFKTSTSPILSHLAQSEEGVAVLRSFGPMYVERMVDTNFEVLDANNRVWFSQTAVNQWFAVRVQMVGFGVVVLVVSTLLVLHEWLSPGLVGVAFMYAVSVDQELSIMVRKWTWLEMTMVSPERVLEYIGIPPEGHANDRLAAGDWPRRGSITFDNVQFAYKAGGDLVLKGLSFHVNHNEKIGIVGRTGAGKSSLTMALFRINELVGGRILLDGVDIATLNLPSLRSRMSIIPQVPVLFKGPLRAYMDPFDEHGDAEIWSVFEKVGVKDMIAGFEGKLQHELSENGENFSVGERQMLCLARALLRKSRVVVMDEATASIDRATEQRLQEMISREFVNATVLTIAHRLATVLHADRILVMSDGRVAEFDTPKRLATIDGGVFRELAKEGGYLTQLLE